MINQINESIVLEAIRRLKKDKTDPFSDLTTNCLKEGTGLLISAITQFFQACTVHEYFPGQLLVKR